MKRKRALAMAITLSLLLANHVSAVELTADSSLSTLDNTNTGLLVNEGFTFNGENENLTITGKETYTYMDGSQDTFGVLNIGTITNIKDLSTESLLNYGKLSTDNLVITCQDKFTAPANGATIFNVGSDTELTINGNIDIVNGGLINNSDGATLRLTGENAVIGTELDNIGAKLIIEEDTYVDHSLWNTENGILEIADGVTVTTKLAFANAGYSSIWGYVSGGTVKAGGANIVVTNSVFSNTDIAEVGSITVTGSSLNQSSNSGNLIINNALNASFNNSGELTYNGTEAINGHLTNNGTIYSTNGILKVNGDLSIADINSGIWKNTDKDLTDLEITGSLSVYGNSWLGQSTLTAKNITADMLINDGHVKADRLEAKQGFVSDYFEGGETSIDVNELVIGNYVDDDGNSWASIIGDSPSGTTHYGNSVVRVHEKLVFDSSNGVPILENRDRLFLDGDAVVIEGNGKIVNQEIYTYWSGTSIGVIAKNENKEAIENLTINSELVNQGELYVKNLSVLKGVDGIEQADGSFKESHAFDVENLNILDSGSFELKKDNYTFTSVGVGTNADLTAAGSLTVNDAMALQDGASVKTLGEGENNFISAGSLSVGDGGSITTGVITVSKNELDGSTTTGSVITGTGSTITADTLSAAGNVSVNGTADVSESITTSSLMVGNGSSVTTATLNLNGNADDGKGTITLGGAVTNADGTQKAAALNVANGITANALTSAAGSVITVGADKDIEIAGALELGGAAAANKITAATLATGANSELTANTLDVTDAVIGGKATVNVEMTATGSIDVNTAGSLTAETMNVDGALTLIKADSEKGGAYVKVANGLTAGAVGIGDYGILEAGSVDADGSISLGDGASAAIEGDVVAKTLVAADESNINAENVIVSEGVGLGAGVTANVKNITVSDGALSIGDNSELTAGVVTASEGISLGAGVTANVNDITVSDGALVVEEGSALTAGAVDVSGSVIFGDKVNATVTSLTADEFGVGDNSILTAASVNVDGAMSVGEGASAEITNTVEAGALGVASGSSLFADVVMVDEAMSLGEGASATVTKGVEAGALGIASGGSLFADVVMVDEAMSLGQKANITVTNDIMAKMLTALDGSSIKADDVTASEGISLGADVTASVKDITISEGALSIGDNSELTAGVVTASEGIGLGAGVTANVKDITISSGSLQVEKESTLTASAVDVSGSVIFGDTVNIKAADITAKELAVGGSSSFTAQNLHVDTEIDLGAGVDANVNDVTAGLLYVQNGGAITANDINVQSLGFANNVTAEANNAIANDLLAGQESVISMQDVKVARTLNLGERTYMSVNDVQKAQSIVLNDEAVLNACNVQDTQNITLEDGASLSAVNVDKVQNIVLDSKAAMSADAIAMSDEASITSSGGNIKTDVLTGGSLAFNLLTKETEQIYVGNLTSDSLTVNVNDLTEKQVVIGNYTGGDVSVIGSGSVTDSFGSDMPSIEEGMQKLADTLQINGNEDVQLIAEEGSVLGEITGTVTTDGSLTVTGEKVNSFNQGISEMASIALMTWRQENNDMNKRLGELRDSSGEHGVWVRMTRGESKYGAQNIKNQYNSYQLGYDEKLSVDKHWTVGAALTYTDANSSFRGGKGENKHKGLAVYGSRLNDDGSFIDLIARYARLEHDFEVRGGAGKGDFDTNGYSLSAEYGKRFTQKSGLWFEPQAELTYGRVGSASYLTDKGVRVRQEGMDSLVGRLGFALGQNLAKGKGNVYLRASYLYDFEGETDVRFANPTQNRSFKQDLGGGWWEVGVGANVNISKAAHLYFDVEKTYGGNVATPWQWNAGLRWSF